MRFATEEVIAQPPAEVYAGLTDFAGHEAAIAARGIETRRIPGTEGPEPAWEAEIEYRGRLRHVEVLVTRMTPPIALDYRLEGSHLVSELSFGLEPLDGGRTRLAVTLDVRPEGLPGRMLLQSLKLLRPTLVKRFRKRVRSYADYLAQGIS